MEDIEVMYKRVWATLDRMSAEAAARAAEEDKRNAEAAARAVEEDKRNAEAEKRNAEAEKRNAEAEKRNAEAEKRMKKLEKLVGGISYNNGSFAEEYFFNSFENGEQNFFGEKFDEISKNLKYRWQGLEDEYDIALFNHASVALIEAKYKAHENDIPGVLKKAETFRILFPHYKDFKIYLGLASMSFYPELEQKCIDQGIAVIKQVGETVVINDTNLKVF